MAANSDIILKLRLKGEEFDRDFKVKFQDLTDAAEKASAQSGARAGGGFTKGFLGAAGLGALGAAIGVAIKNAADLGKEIASTSKQFNISAENLQVWRQAAASAGVGADNFADGLSSLAEKIGQANAGNRQAQQSFVDLGIGFKTTAGEARATDAVMLDLAKRIASISEPTERVRLGQQLLGDDFKALYPLLLQGADGFSKAAAEADRFGMMLSAEEIQDLDATNRKIEELKNQLQRSAAKVVAENADAITSLTESLLGLADAALKGAGAWSQFMNSVGDYSAAAESLPKGMSPAARAKALQGLDTVYGRRDNPMSPWQRLTTGERAMTFSPISPYDPRFAIGLSKSSAVTDLSRNFTSDLLREFETARNSAANAAPPSLSGAGGSPRRSGGRSRSTGQSAAAREAERAAKEAIRNEEQFRDALARSLREQQDSADIARIRADLGDAAAARAEAELGFLRQHPLAVSKTVEELAKALGFTQDITEEQKKNFQGYLDQAAALKAGLGDAAEAKARADALAKQQREDDERDQRIERERQKWEAEYTAAINNVADIYETAFRGGTKDLWRSFKDEGTRIIAEIAAQWTLAMISGQGFNLNSALGGAMGRSPLASIFLGTGALGAANDNGLFSGPTMTGFGGGIFGLGGRGVGAAGGLLPSGGDLPTTGGRFNATLRGGAGFLQSPTFALGLGTLTTSLVGGGQASQLGGLVGSIGGQALGSSIAALGSFGGPIGAIAGALLGSVLPKVLSGPKRASVTVGGAGGTLGITGRQGNSAAREATATQGAGSLIDAIFQIADQLGGGVDASRGSVSFGMRKNSFRVDPTGRGITKIGNGAIDFGSDQEAAIRFAVQDLIRDGVITGISQASQNLLQRGGDLEAQIEKALLIEQIPKLLRQRFDPLGAALDELFDKFKAVNDALVEGSASAEQFAQARQLWELEKADAIASVGAASQSLKDFLAALNAGSSSPLSLREQRAEAERQLEPFLAQITAAERARAEVDRLRAGGASAAEIEAAEAAARTAAAAINQEGFTQASQLLLGISRQSNASSGAYFSDFDRIRALTGSAIGFVDQASAREADTRDPFARETAANTRESAIILSELSAESRAQGETLRQIAAALSGGSGGGFIRENRAFAR